MKSPHGLTASVIRGADAVFLFAACVAFACLSYVLYSYYWIGARQFANPLAGRVLVLGLAAATGALVAALKVPDAFRVNAALALCSAMFCVYALESALSVWSSLPSVQQQQYQRQLAVTAKAQGVRFDLRTKAQVVSDLRARQIAAVPSMHPKGLLEDQPDGTKRSAINSNGPEMLPLGGISNRVTVVCNEGGDYLTYTSDEHGFHNPPGIWRRAPVDVVVLGDSFVQGWCVPDGRDFVSLIRRRYPSTISVGIEGDGPLTMLATLREYGATLKPHVVLWCYFEANDVSDLRDESKSPLLRDYLNDSFGQRLIDRQAQIDQVLNSYVEKFMDTGSLRVRAAEMVRLFSTVDAAERQVTSILKLTMLRSRLGALGGGGNDGGATAVNTRHAALADTFDLLKQTLVVANKLTKERNGTLYFVYLPARDRYDRTASGPNPDRETVLNIAKNVGLPIIDIDSAFSAQGDPLALFPFRLASHYNETGHQLAADTILATLPQ